MPSNCDSKRPEVMERHQIDGNHSTELQKHTDIFMIRSEGDVSLLLYNSTVLGPNMLHTGLEKADPSLS